ncbi:uncharacterized protein LOC110716236 isoform X1 [Chenopodium quinoa]|uniref:uncharacterized protein LOC110716236 isoform X1 n=1 Tax=Chenopodium quinoa TaxID=63459 RepID=UPI000B78DE93|nr:uncharacterized protein LOC110716236 isoform X1 [Chenopodium quinoa]
MDKLDAKIIVASYSITCSQIRRFAISLIVEGSSDGGSNWYVLDRQTSQKFDSYFQRKLYRVGSRHTQSNAISTRQPHSNSRTTSQHRHQARTGTCGISSIAQLQNSAPE